nr:hepatocyte growth factor-like protein [Cherax quadricarinatus]
MTYSGTGNITAQGEPCLSWSDPRVQPKVKALLMAADLRDNYCANPDNDDMPWCFTAREEASFCDIPRYEDNDFIAVVLYHDKDKKRTEERRNTAVGLLAHTRQVLHKSNPLTE